MTEHSASCTFSFLYPIDLYYRNDRVDIY